VVLKGCTASDSADQKKKKKFGCGNLPLLLPAHTHECRMCRVGSIRMCRTGWVGSDVPGWVGSDVPYRVGRFGCAVPGGSVRMCRTGWVGPSGSDVHPLDLRNLAFFFFFFFFFFRAGRVSWVVGRFFVQWHKSCANNNCANSNCVNKQSHQQ
jgi:hypothetical protein